MHTENNKLSQVSENGAISFESPVSGPPQANGPSLFQDAQEVLLIAPFWTDHNLGLMGGMVRYETYEPDGPAREQRLNFVSEFLVNQTSDLEVFHASWMILAEWRDIRGNVNANPVSLVIITQCAKTTFVGQDSYL